MAHCCMRSMYAAATEERRVQQQSGLHMPSDLKSDSVRLVCEWHMGRGALPTLPASTLWERARRYVAARYVREQPWYSVFAF